MKNLFLCFALVGMASTLCAQERGDMLVSGSLSWSSSSTKTTVSSTSETTKGSRSFEFTPQFHYFVINKLSVGLGIGYSLEKDPNGRTGSDDEQLFDKKGLFYFQPMASYYIPLGKKFYYVPRFYIGFGFGKNKSELTSKEVSEEDASRFRVGISALNFEFRPTDHIGIMFNAGDLGYQTTVIKQDGDNKVSNRDFSLGLNVGATIAFNYYF